MVNGADSIFYEKDGHICKWDRQFYSKEKLEDVIQQIVAAGNKIVNEANPIVDTRLKDGSRVNIVLSPIALDGSAVTIRKFPEQPMRMQQLIRLEAISEEAADFLKQLVQAGYNIFISGGTGAGKTTFLNALSEFIPSEERLITIEDSAELQIHSIPNLIRLETRTANMEGVKEITIRDLIRTSLRMRPNRIIVGECRGPETLDMLQAMNTGHPVRTSYQKPCLFLHLIINKKIIGK
ncbi:putative conjugal transfer protein [Eubacterium plexicaudatum ASF492]|nr:putative conjugal transfer protein [Eubacterium plexicaudatum ASF492]